MEIVQAIILGVIEGLTEFLPISSTGHLIVAEEYMNFTDASKTFTIAIQLGAILAVVWYYREDLVKKIAGLFKEETNSQKFFLNILIAAIPAGLLGFALDKKFETYATPKVVAIALIVGAAVLWLADRKIPARNEEKIQDLGKLSSGQAITVGLAQCFALVPGVSRSGASIVGGLISGMNRVTATSFSFYLGIPILGGASLFKLIQNHDQLSTVSGGAKSILIGAVVSFIVALGAVSWLLKYVSTHSFKLFVYWRILLGIVVLLVLV